MSISAITAATATSTVQSATGRHHRANPVQQLFDAINSGDLSAAQTAYQNLLANVPGTSSTNTSTSSGSATSGTASTTTANPLQQLLDQIGTALQSGDITSAQSALASFQANAPGGPGGAGGDQSTTGKAISSLFSAIQSGDLPSAQSDYATVSSLLGSASTGSTTGSTSATSQDPFQQLISQIGAALQSGDISSAQSALSQFQSNAPPPPPPAGNGPDSATGQALSSLFSSIQSGDLSSAQSAYSSLESLLGSGTSSGAATSGATTTTASSGNGSASQDLFQQLLSSIGTDLSNSDLTSAQSALADFSKTARSGLAYNFYA